MVGKSNQQIYHILIVASYTSWRCHFFDTCFS